MDIFERGEGCGDGGARRPGGVAPGERNIILLCIYILHTHICIFYICCVVYGWIWERGGRDLVMVELDALVAQHLVKDILFC